MSFLASKKILINSIYDKIILSINENNKENDMTENYDGDDKDFD